MVAFKTRLKETIYERLKALYPLSPADIDLALTPNPAMGDLALAFPLQLAKALKKPPRAIAQEAAATLAGIEGVTKAEIAGPGFINLFLDRAAFFAAAVAAIGRPGLTPDEGKI